MSNAVVPLRTGGKVAGIIPQSIDEVFRLAAGIAKSGLAPSTMNTTEKITVAILHGLEIGLPPMQSIQKIAVVNGRPTLWGDAIPALLWANGLKMREWLTETAAHCEITRPDGTKIERSFSWTDAEKAGLKGKAGPWKQYPDRMLAMRARGFAARDGAADILSGLYLREEVEDEQPARDITPATFAIPDIPDEAPAVIDIPDEPETIADASGFLAKLKEELGEANDPATRMEIWEGYADMIDRLSDADRRIAEAYIEQAAE